MDYLDFSPKNDCNDLSLKKLEDLTKSLMERDSPYVEEIKEKDKIINRLSKKKNILIVDSHIDNSFILDIILNSLGYRIFKAKNNLEAFDIFKDYCNNNKQIDIILMDMRASNCIESTNLIRNYEKTNNLNNSKIIVLTDHHNSLEPSSDNSSSILFNEYCKTN